MLLGLGDADTLDGGNGIDILDGRGGIDKMHGGADDDTYIVDHPDDAAIEAAGEGALDRVQTSVTYGLAEGRRSRCWKPPMRRAGRRWTSSATNSATPSSATPEQKLWSAAWLATS